MKYKDLVYSMFLGMSCEMQIHGCVPCVKAELLCAIRSAEIIVRKLLQQEIDDAVGVTGNRAILE